MEAKAFYPTTNACATVIHAPVMYMDDCATWMTLARPGLEREGSELGRDGGFALLPRLKGR